MSLAQAPREVSRPPVGPVAAVPLQPRRRWLDRLVVVREIVLLAWRVVAALVTAPKSWWAEFVDQAWRLARRTTLPLAISAFAFGYGAAGIEGANFTSVVGAIDRVGAFASAGTVREISVWITGMLVTGVAGTAVCADLGARKIRQELDAMAVLGIDVTRRLVAPRVLALTLLMPALGVVAMSASILALLLVGLQFGGSAAGFWSTFTATLNTIDLLAFAIKTLIFGFVVSVVCCYMGLNAKGGPQGVGRAVNQAVVIGFVVVWIINYAFNSVYQAGFPELQGLR